MTKSDSNKHKIKSDGIIFGSDPCCNGCLEEISASEKRFRTLYENVTDGVMIIGKDYTIKDINDRTCQITGFKREELIGEPCDLLCPKGKQSKACPIWEKHLSGFTGMDTTIKCKGGHKNPILKNARKIWIDEVECICESFSDISYLKEIETNLTVKNQELKGILESAPIGIGLVTDYIIKDSNEQLATMIGFTAKELIGKDVREFYPCSTEVFTEMLEAESRHLSTEMTVRHRDGSEVNIIITIDILGRNEEDNTHNVLITLLNITERHKAREKIWRQAYYDKLTKLPNRAHILKELQRNIDHDAPISLLLFDLNKFKEVNDNYGHLVGDDLLKKVSYSLNSFIKAPNFVGRLGGDEFIIIVHSRDRQELEEFCQELSELIAQRCVVEPHSIRVSASIGIVSDAENVNDYLLRADLAMYEAKNLSKMRPQGAYKFFTTSMLKSHEIKAQMKEMLLKAFENHEFDIVYQPVYNIKTMTIEGVEALLRWNHPSYGEVAPEVIVPIADETGVLVQIGHWMIDQVGRTLQSLQRQIQQLKKTDFYISINMTLQQLSDPDLINVFTLMLEEYQIDGSIIMIDITDTSALDKRKWSLSIINKLKSFGVSISIDDFGIGYSALSNVDRSSINILKIDRSYISKLHIERNMDITRAIIQLAKALDLRVIAEGVESLEQFKMVRELECDAAQGYYLNTPLNLHDLHELIYNLYV